MATNGPTIRPIWFLWEDGAFWWLTGAWSLLSRRLDSDPRIALVVDSCDLHTGRVLQVTAKGRAEAVAMDRARAVRKLAKYLGPDPGSWPPDRFLAPLDDPVSRLIRLVPDGRLAVRDVSYEPAQRMEP